MLSHKLPKELSLGTSRDHSSLMTMPQLERYYDEMYENADAVAELMLSAFT